ncbi:MAG: hypothetical protein LBE91_02915 [Tannerella sp.]|jgi:hypothetical protein|nr:hypothetical protein [Tannerella sp.]
MVRMLENLTVALPFVIFLVCKQQFYPVIILIVLNIIMALSNFKTTHSFTIPTPFYKKPFEFTVGFRNTFFLFPIAYGLTVIAVTVGNFNLGIFSLLLIFLTVLSYYVKYENEYFVWSYSLSPAKFLMEKISIAFSFSFYLCIPIVILLSVIFFEYIGILLFSTLLGYLYLVTIILAKYTAYPDEMNFAQAILLVICIFFPPMLIAVIPYFANKSVSKLKVYLK